MGAGERERHRPPERLATHERRLIGVGITVEHLERALRQAFDAIRREIESVIEAKGSPAWKQLRRHTHQEARVPVQAGHDEHARRNGLARHTAGLPGTLESSSGMLGCVRIGGLFGQPEFVKLWFAHTISRFGSEVTMLAIPLTAALVL